MKNIKRADNGLYYRNLGYLLPAGWQTWKRELSYIEFGGAKPSVEIAPYPSRPTQPKFYLGRTERDAEIAAGRLEQI
jgi:hypothetical protein